MTTRPNPLVRQARRALAALAAIVAALLGACSQDGATSPRPYPAFPTSGDSVAPTYEFDAAARRAPAAPTSPSAPTSANAAAPRSDAVRR